MNDDTETTRQPLRSRPVTRRRGLPFQSRVVVLTLAGGLPALFTAFILLRDAPIADSVYRLIVVVLIGVWVGFAIAVHHATVEPMRSIANLLEALRGGDYAIRGRHGKKGDALGDIVLESNRLGATLRSQRFEALEASALLNKVLAEIDVAVLAFDGDDRVRLTNRAAGELLRRHPDALMGLSAAEIGIHDLLEGPTVSNESHTFPGRAGTLADHAGGVPRGRPAVPPAGRDRPQPGAARRGAARVAAPDPRDLARAQQFPRPDQVRDRDEPRCAGGGLAGQGRARGAGP